MKLYAQVLDSVVAQTSWDSNFKKESGWYEIDHEPNPLTERFRYDPVEDRVVIEPRVKNDDEKAAEKKAAEDAELMKPDTIRGLQAKIAELEKRIAALEKT